MVAMMTMFEHEPGCDGAHTVRQRCNARGLREGAVDDIAPAIPYGTSEATPTTAKEPPPHMDAELSDGPPNQTHVAAVAPAAQTVDAPPDDNAAPASSRAIADGPLQPTDTAGLPFLPVIATVAVSIGLLAGVSRLFRRRRRRE